MKIKSRSKTAAVRTKRTSSPMHCPWISLIKISTRPDRPNSTFSFSVVQKIPGQVTCIDNPRLNLKNRLTSKFHLTKIINSNLKMVMKMIKINRIKLIKKVIQMQTIHQMRNKKYRINKLNKKNKLKIIKIKLKTKRLKSKRKLRFKH